MLAAGSTREKREEIMAVYALWNNKGGGCKSYLTFQIASEYARTHRDQKVLVIDPVPASECLKYAAGRDH